MTLLLAVLFVVVSTWGITRWVYRRMLASETRKAEAQRQTLRRAVQASETEDQNLKLLRASRPPQAPGLKHSHRRVS